MMDTLVMVSITVTMSTNVHQVYMFVASIPIAKIQIPATNANAMSVTMETIKNVMI